MDQIKTACCPQTAPAPSDGSSRPPSPAPCTCKAPVQAEAEERPGYRIEPFVTGLLQTSIGPIPQVATRLNGADLLGRWQMRWGLGRNRYRIAPGLYAAGTPGDESPVLVTANYKMTFDALRCELSGVDVWILVLETRGINVWCAAGKGTFGTEEIVHRVRKTGLERLVKHRRLILPQLGAPGVTIQEVGRETGFRPLYGPVRARDIQPFLSAGMRATPQMRRVTFSIGERFALTPVELAGMLKPMLWAALALLVGGGLGEGFFSLEAAFHRGSAALAAILAGVLTGAVFTPVLLPWIPGRAFAVKGALAGLAFATPPALVFASRLGTMNTAALLLALPAVASWCAMHFTGSTTFTSPSGVEKEMRRAIPLQAASLLLAAILWIGSVF